MPPRPIDQLSDQEIENLIENHRHVGLTSAPRYLEALEENARRRGGGLNFETSLAIIRKAAAARRFLSYKELANASGVEWARVHYAMNDHLWSLVEYAYRHGLPMLSAIVVNKENVETGEMKPETLSGFVAAAENLGLHVGDPHAFLREQQRLVFEWGSPRDATSAAEQ